MALEKDSGFLGKFWGQFFVKSATQSQQTDSNGHSTNTTGGRGNNVRHGDDASSVDGTSTHQSTNHQTATTDSNATTAGTVSVTVGTPQQIHGNGAARSNATLAKPLGIASSQGDDRKSKGGLLSSLISTCESITKATVTLDADEMGSFEPTGDILDDFVNLEKYYINMLKKYSLKNTLKRIKLLIKLEVEKIEKQLKVLKNNLKKLSDDFKQVITTLDLSKLKQDPSDENTPGKVAVGELQTAEAANKEQQERNEADAVS